MVDKTFSGEKLRKARETSGLNPTELMFALDRRGLRISRATIINWERNYSTPDANEIIIVANLLGKGVEYFFG